MAILERKLFPRACKALEDVKREDLHAASGVEDDYFARRPLDGDEFDVTLNGRELNREKRLLHDFSINLMRSHVVFARADDGERHVHQERKRRKREALRMVVMVVSLQNRCGCEKVGSGFADSSARVHEKPVVFGETGRCDAKAGGIPAVACAVGAVNGA